VYALAIQSVRLYVRLYVTHRELYRNGLKRLQTVRPASITAFEFF